MCYSKISIIKVLMDICAVYVITGCLFYATSKQNDEINDYLNSCVYRLCSQLWELKDLKMTQSYF